MGRPRGKSKKPIEAASNDDEDGSGGEEVPPTPKRRGRPQKPLKEDADTATAAEVEDEADGIQPAARAISKDSRSATENGAGGKKRRRRRPKRSPDDDGSVEEDDEGHVKSKSNGFRPNGSRRKSTPRRAAEAGVECK